MMTEYEKANAACDRLDASVRFTHLEQKLADARTLNWRLGTLLVVIFIAFIAARIG